MTGTEWVITFGIILFILFIFFCGYVVGEVSGRSKEVNERSINK